MKWWYLYYTCCQDYDDLEFDKQPSLYGDSEVMSIYPDKDSLSSIRSANENIAAKEGAPAEEAGDVVWYRQTYPLPYWLAQCLPNSGCNYQLNWLYNKLLLIIRVIFTRCIYVGWTLAVLTIVVPGFFVILYSFEWGAQKSQEWLAALLLSFFESVILVQPFKVNYLF